MLLLTSAFFGLLSPQKLNLFWLPRLAALGFAWPLWSLAMTRQPTSGSGSQGHRRPSNPQSVATACSVILSFVFLVTIATTTATAVWTPRQDSTTTTTSRITTRAPTPLLLRFLLSSTPTTPPPAPSPPPFFLLLLQLRLLLPLLPLLLLLLLCIPLKTLQSQAFFLAECRSNASGTWSKNCRDGQAFTHCSE